jgi:hypothetical protein
MFLLVSSTDHIAGVTGLTPTVKLSKAGGTGASPSGAITEVDSTNFPGLYKVAGNATDTNTLGSLILHATGTGADPVDVEFEVVAYDPQSASLGIALPTNFSSLSIDGSGRTDVAKIAGMSQTARDLGASVLLSSGTGTGQLDFTGGVVKSNLVQILATALTETAGLLAGGFKKLFNVASPTGTLNSLPGAVAGAAGGLAIVGSNMGTVSSVTGNVAGNVEGDVMGAVNSVNNSVDVATVLGDAITSASFASGATVPADVVTILGTAITETTSGNLAAAYTHFFDVSSPVGTVNSIPGALAF